MIGPHYTGSELPAPDQYDCLGACDPGEIVQATIVLRRRNQPALDALLRGMERGDPAAKPVTRKGFARRFGASAADFAAVRAFARRNRLAILNTDSGACSALLSGSVAQFDAAFGVKLMRYRHPEWGTYLGHAGAATIPEPLQGIAMAVLGLDRRPAARTNFRIRRHADISKKSYTPPQLASIYDFPAGDGAGQCIALIELGGGYRAADVARYFDALGLTRQPVLVDVAVGDGGNAPTGDPSGPDGEVSLDIEVAGAIAPGARIAVYFATNSAAGFIQAVSQAVHDQINQPSVLSISWGGPEAGWPAQAIRAFEQVLQAAAALGVTICVAAGDSGSGGGVSGDGKNVDFPASSAYVLACGGTRLDAFAPGRISETVWNDGSAGGATGGGVSRMFAVPTWQRHLTVTRASGGTAPLTGRGVPDVAGDADPASGYAVSVDGTPAVVGGTSAVAPLWAALVARINAASGRTLGWLNPVLYAHPSALRDIVDGNNGGYSAAPGWDACTGLGSPDGAKIGTAVRQSG
ncbi:MAG: S53 family peptidase [Bordetella sp.]|uniref:S53 family peptidase n=1 Tax=Bordetella sp. TaxID=28081 RepID=UPI003F7C09B6